MIVALHESMVFSVRTYPAQVGALEYERKRRYADDQRGVSPLAKHFSVSGLLKPGIVSVVVYGPYAGPIAARPSVV